VTTLVVLLLSGCVISRPEPPRFYDPLPLSPIEAHARATKVATLRLRHTRAASYLAEPIAWRVSEVELGTYPDRRWIAPPAELVERALIRRLFEQDGLERASSGAPTLEVTVVAFDEILGRDHQAQVALLVSLTDARDRPLVVETVIARRPIGGKSGHALATAMGEALEEAIETVAARVGAALSG
jgi:ABC-type uncharacterized transport system auxiliary subunit